MVFLHADYTQLQWLYEDWTEGIQEASSDPAVVKRIAPIRCLEYGMTQKGLTQIEWWASAAMRKAVHQRKTLIHAILRGLPDPRGLQCKAVVVLCAVWGLAWRIHSAPVVAHYVTDAICEMQLYVAVLTHCCACICIPHYTQTR